MFVTRPYIQKMAVESLIRLGNRLNLSGPPPKIVGKAIEANPWFTPYYIERAWEGIAAWLTEAGMQELTNGFEAPDLPPARIGIIAAGNVPWVGLHDLLVALVSGHEVHIKFARQDTVLMEWFRTEWQQEWTGIEKIFHVVKLPEQVDFLLATGSNNSARYFETYYQHTPYLIRKHRYSVAYLDNTIQDEELAALRDDIFLYNGLGCRNVSNLILSPGFPVKRLQETLETYPHSCLNSHYLERVLWTGEINRVLGTSVIHTPSVILEPAIEPGSSSMGILRLIFLEKEQNFRFWNKNIQRIGSVSLGKMLNLEKLNHQKYPITRIT